MKRNTFHFWLDIALFLVMTIVILSGLVMKFLLPPGTGGRSGGPRLELGGLGRHDIGAIHFYLALALLAGLVLHLALHWKWVNGTLWGFARARTANGQTQARQAGWQRRIKIASLTFVVFILGLGTGGFFWAKNTIVASPEPAGPAGASRSHDAETQSTEVNSPQINGRLTLAEVASAYQLSLEELIQELGLPADVDPDERLGRLCRQYDITMNEVRETADLLSNK